MGHSHRGMIMGTVFAAFLALAFPARADDFDKVDQLLRNLKPVDVKSSRQAAARYQPIPDEFLADLEERYEIELKPAPGRCPCDAYDAYKDGALVADIKSYYKPEEASLEHRQAGIERQLKEGLAKKGLPSSGVKWIFLQRDAAQVMANIDVSRTELSGRTQLTLPLRQDHCGLEPPDPPVPDEHVFDFGSDFSKVVVSRMSADVVTINAAGPRGRTRGMTIARGCLRYFKETP